ncbi:MAG TPA: hypothetical protein DCX06_01095 [Opitutae bacterium]|nr:hypothetical protein [Opitutae bacterium]
MKSLLRTSLALLLSINLLSAETEPSSEILLRGVLDMGTTQTFSLSTKDGIASKWVKVGQSFKDHTVVSFDSDTQILTVDHAGETKELSLEAAQEGNGPSGDMETRLAEAKHLMSLIDFEDMMDKTIAAQMDAMAEMMTKQMAANGEVDDALIAFQQKAVSEMFSEIDWEPIKEGMSKAYAETFTQDELSSISSFYATPAGKATITKQPELQEKTMKIMMPAIMSAAGSMQQKMMKFMQERQAAE